MKENFIHILSKELVEDALVIMCGLPATGKSTVAKSISKEKDYKILSSDILRLEALRGEDVFDQKVASNMNKRLIVYKLMFMRAEDIITKEKKGVLLDATFIQQELRKQAASIAYKYKKPLYIIETKCSPHVAVARIKNRNRLQYESNAITEEAYFNNHKIYEPVDINDILHEFLGITIYYYSINTNARRSYDWFVEDKYAT